MKVKQVITLLLAVCIYFSFSVTAFADEPDSIECETAVLLNADTSQVLYDKNMNKKMNPASITKIMTALLTIENTTPDEILTVSKTALDIEAYSTSIWLKEGETITVDDALYALLIASANDVANVLAERVAGSQEAFAVMMTERAKELGAVNTTFKNAHGLSEDGHLTTAYDMALITQEAMKNPVFAKYFGVQFHEIAPTAITNVSRYLYNHHDMLMEKKWIYTPEVIGGKTGYTSEAGNTLVTVARKGGQTLICVTLKSPSGDKFLSTRSLLEYGFNDFTTYDIPVSDLDNYTVPILDHNLQVGEANLKFPKTYKVTLPKGTDIKTLQTSLINCDSFSLGCIKGPTLSICSNNNTKPIVEIPLKYSVSMFPTNIPEIDNQPEKESRNMHQSFTSFMEFFSLKNLTIYCAIVFLIFIVSKIIIINKHRKKRRRS